MEFKSLILDLKRLSFDEVRKEYEGYMEFVLTARHLIHLYPVLEKYYGLPFKPPGVNPTQEAKNHSQAYGGILKQQTLYYVEHQGVSHCAMIWPWGDGSKATVKVAQGKILKAVG